MREREKKNPLTTKQNQKTKQNNKKMYIFRNNRNETV